MMDLNAIRTKFIEYMQAQGHTEIPSSPLVPENDPTTLFTGSGMQPLIPYLLGKEHPSGARLVNSQKCFRSGDLEEVGDNRHTTYFEMLGNWSLGDYGKQEQIAWFFGFLVDELGIEPSRLYVTVYAGNEALNIPRDEVAATIWRTLFSIKGVSTGEAHMGTEAEGAARGMQKDERIFYYGSKNWWSRVGDAEKMPAGEPGGPDSEVFYEFPDVEHNPAFGKQCHPNCDCGRFLEIGNSVFMQYQKQEDGTFAPLPKENVDFGGGLERLVMAVNDTPDIIEANHAPIVDFVAQATKTTYNSSDEATYAHRIIADHMKATVFLIGDDVHPSNTDQGYFVRRLIRRAVRFADKLGMHEEGLARIVDPIVAMYETQYPNLREKHDRIALLIADEERKFRATIAHGLKKIERLITRNTESTINAEQLFDLYQTDGFPLELSLEVIGEHTETQLPDTIVDEFNALLRAHKEKSRAGSEQKFKGGLADASEATSALHTCTHLMLAGLRKYLGDHVHQAGSNITVERTRFDFTHNEKVSRDILDKVEEYVNEAIQKGCTVHTTTMNKDEAQKEGVEGSFWEKYPDKVTVYEVAAEDLPAPRPDIYYVYAILCDDDSIYVGQTQDIQHRWEAHKEGTAAEHTKKHRPVRVIHIEEFLSREEAVKRESDLKTEFGRKWLKREYAAGRTRQAGGTVYSRELCGGPHVESTEDISGTFKITKEQASSAGVRRVKAKLE